MILSDKYVNEKHYIVTAAALKHSIDDHREQEGTEQRFVPSPSLNFQQKNICEKLIECIIRLIRIKLK